MATVDDNVMPEIRKWRSVFLETTPGREVLADMLTELHVFDSVKNEEEMALQNFGKWILYRLGIYNDDTIYKIVDKLAEIDYTVGKE